MDKKLLAEDSSFSKLKDVSTKPSPKGNMI